MIYFAVDDNGTALAACMSKPMVEDNWKICKLGSNKKCLIGVLAVLSLSLRWSGQLIMDLGDSLFFKTVS